MRKYKIIILLPLLVLSACNSSIEYEAIIDQQNELIAELEEVVDEYELAFLGNWYSGLGDVLPIFMQATTLEFLPDGNARFDGRRRTWETSGDEKLLVSDWSDNEGITFNISLDEDNVLFIQDNEGNSRSWTRDVDTVSVNSLPENARGYQEIIEAFSTIERSERTGEIDPIWYDVLLIDYQSFAGFHHNFYRNGHLMFALFDLNGDEIPELMVGIQNTWGSTVSPFAIYTLQDGEPKLVISHFFTTRIGLTTDGNQNPVITNIRGRLGFSNEDFFQLGADGSLITLDRITTSDSNRTFDADGFLIGDPWTFTKEVNGEWVNITRAEYEALMEWYGIMGYATFYGPTGPVAEVFYTGDFDFDFEDTTRRLELDWQPILVRDETEFNELFQLADTRLERLPTGFFQVTDNIQLGIALRTEGDEFEDYFNLSSFASYIKKDSAQHDEGATTAILVPSVEINNFRLLSIGFAYSFDENGNALSFIGDDITSFDTLSPDKPFVITYRDIGSHPSYAISFTDENGLIRYFVLGSVSQTGDGTFFFRELIPVNVQAESPYQTFITIQQLHESMPELTFYRIIGEIVNEDENIRNVTIKIKEDGEVLQVFDDVTQFFTSNSRRDVKGIEDELFEIQFADFTGDGYLDMTLVAALGGSARNLPSYFWLWDARAGQFVRNEDLEFVSSFSHVTAIGDGCVVSYVREGAMGYSYGFWQYTDGEFVRMYTRGRGFSSEKMSNFIWEYNARTGEDVRHYIGHDVMLRDYFDWGC